jgi:hypothetical protein
MKGKELAEWLYTMELQNTNGRENEDEMFMKGIEVGIAHFEELKALNTCTDTGKECKHKCDGLCK